jgi:hypothetical protein
MSCGKATYLTRKEAKKALKKMNRERHWDLENVYFCDTCQCYHTTSMDKKQSRNKTRKGEDEKISPELEALRERVKRNK